MGILDDFVARMKNRTKSISETLTPEEEEKVKELQSMFDGEQKDRVLQTYLKNRKNFEETLDELLKEPQEQPPSNETKEEEVAAPIDNEEGNDSDSSSSDDAPSFNESREVAKVEIDEPISSNPRSIDQVDGETNTNELPKHKKQERNDELDSQLAEITKEFEEKKKMILKKLEKKEERRKKRVLEKEERRKSNTIPLQDHLEKVKQLEEARINVENEKKKAMSWCLAQMTNVQSQNAQQLETINQQKIENENLRQKLKEKDLAQTKFINLLMHAKELLQKDSENDQTREFLELLDKEIPDVDRLPVVTSPLFERKREFPFAEDEIRLVMTQANISREKAIEALLKHNDVVVAILESCDI
eukprot:TRINITY_DN6773_c0_g1_i1.p1 TRINITY_DN6773_c0_g1~~TRINITY_DN6773_c0_g1_i1.p1  ORF type:complete len:360 (+),score=136.82 TRINITY_DN6773_c0_g1_i1:157-1236(+)